MVRAGVRRTGMAGALRTLKTLRTATCRMPRTLRARAKPKPGHNPASFIAPRVLNVFKVLYGGAVVV